MVRIGVGKLTLEQVVQVAREYEAVELPEEAINQIHRSRSCIESILRNGAAIYGVNTGFGKMSDVRIADDELEQLQLNLIRSHACAVGKPYDIPTVRAMMLLRAHSLAQGYSGVSIQVVMQLVRLLNCGVHPVIPEQGSLGASGDLAPLSHLALVLVGEGEAWYQGTRMSGREALERAGIQPIRLQAKDGIALINGTQAMTAVGVLAYADACVLCDAADIGASLTMEALNGIIDAFDARIHRVRPFPEQLEVAERIRTRLAQSPNVTRQGELRVQDAYSIRCIPQVHGATRQVLRYVRDILETECNAVTDNPLVFAKDDGTVEVLSGGNFHGQPVALAMDFLKIGMAELANISERRIERLVNPQLNSFPPFLASKPGVESGLMIPQYVAASLVSENKVLAHPASVDSIPSSANQEDHVSMGTTAARQARQIIENVNRVLAIEWICAAQAIDCMKMRVSPANEPFYRQLRSMVAPLDGDRSLSQDIESVATWMLQKKLDCSNNSRNNEY
jgi:histidine ammonia-lyase